MPDSISTLPLALSSTSISFTYYYDNDRNDWLAFAIKGMVGFQTANSSGRQFGRDIELLFKHQIVMGLGGALIIGPSDSMLKFSVEFEYERGNIVASMLHINDQSVRVQGTLQDPRYSIGFGCSYEFVL